MSSSSSLPLSFPPFLSLSFPLSPLFFQSFPLPTHYCLQPTPTPTAPILLSLPLPLPPFFLSLPVSFYPLLFFFSKIPCLRAQAAIPHSLSLVSLTPSLAFAVCFLFFSSLLPFFLTLSLSLSPFFQTFLSHRSHMPLVGHYITAECFVYVGQHEPDGFSGSETGWGREAQ